LHGNRSTNGFCLTATDFFASQRARGGTVLGPALRAAYGHRSSDRPLNVVLLSDGMTEAGEQSELLGLINSRPEGVRVFCVGVGNEVNRPLLEQMANKAGGLASFVSTEDSFDRQAHLMRQKLIRPAIANLSVSFAGDKITDVEPTQLGDLFYGTPVRLLGRYASGGPVEVTMRGEIQGSEWEQTVNVKLPSSDEGHSPIERMWALKRVSRLLGEERELNANHQDEIVRLSEGYSIVSPYASMLVLENNGEFQRWKIEQRNATRIARDRSSRETLHKKLATLREKKEYQLVNTDAPKGSKQPSLSTPTNATPDTTIGPASPRSVDLNVPSQSGGGGGGAIDPITATIALGAAAAAAISRRRKKAE
jgi:Ca-activated chloride channel homolog